MTLDFSPPSVFAAPKTSEGEFVHSIWDWEWEGLVDGRLPSYSNRGEVSAALYDGGYRRDAYGVPGGGAAAAGSGEDWINEAAAHEAIYKDVLDLLPTDPFGMELGSNWIAAIAGWIDDLRVECQQGDYYNKEAKRESDCGLIAGINFLYSNAAWLSFDSSEQHGKSGCYDKLIHFAQGDTGGLSSSPEMNSADEMLCHPWAENPVPANSQGGGVRSQSPSWCSDIVAVSNTVHETPIAISTQHTSNGAGAASASNTAIDIQVASSSTSIRNHDEGGTSYIEAGQAPHDGLFYALRFLEVQDLLSVERVCKTLRSAVRDDPLLWRRIHISQPLNERLTDDTLFQLAQRADGNLQCLNLVHCIRITNDGLARVLERNPYLTKLSVPGCRLSIEALVDSLKLFNMQGTLGIKQLRIGGLYGVTEAHYDELKQILGMDGRQHLKVRKPRFYGAGLPSCEFDDALDVELCPICQNLRVVYDCPSESCKHKSTGLCRGCNICIARCGYCGRCLTDSEYEETFYLDFYCLDCVDYLVRSEETLVEGVEVQRARDIFGHPDGLVEEEDTGKPGAAERQWRELHRLSVGGTQVVLIS